jgi:hypothetical protein
MEDNTKQTREAISDDVRLALEILSVPMAVYAYEGGQLDGASSAARRIVKGILDCAADLASTPWQRAWRRESRRPSSPRRGASSCRGITAESRRPLRWRRSGRTRGDALPLQRNQSASGVTLSS